MAARVLAVAACLAAAAPASEAGSLIFSGFDGNGWGLWRVTGGGPEKVLDGEMRGPVTAAGKLAFASPAGRILLRDTGSQAEAAAVDGLPLPCGQPTLSPDGATLVAACFRFSNRVDDGGLYRVDLGSGAVEVLYDGPGLQKSPVFSPDGARLAFVTGFRLSAERVVEQVWVIGADGAAPRAIADRADQNIDPAWLDGDTVVYSSDAGGALELWRHDLAAARSAPVPGTEGAMEAAGAGDGSLAFVRLQPGATGLWVADADGARRVAMTETDGLLAAHDPYWSDDY